MKNNIKFNSNNLMDKNLTSKKLKFKQSIAEDINKRSHLNNVAMKFRQDLITINQIAEIMNITNKNIFDSTKIKNHLTIDKDIALINKNLKYKLSEELTKKLKLKKLDILNMSPMFSKEDERFKNSKIKTIPIHISKADQNLNILNNNLHDVTMNSISIRQTSRRSSIKTERAKLKIKTSPNAAHTFREEFKQQRWVSPNCKAVRRYSTDSKRNNIPVSRNDINEFLFYKVSSSPAKEVEYQTTLNTISETEFKSIELQEFNNNDNNYNNKIKPKINFNQMSKTIEASPSNIAKKFNNNHIIDNNSKLGSEFKLARTSRRNSSLNKITLPYINTKSNKLSSEETVLSRNKMKIKELNFNAIKILRNQNQKKVDVIVLKRMNKLKLLDDKIKICIKNTENMVKSICDSASKVCL